MIFTVLTRCSPRSGLVPFVSFAIRQVVSDEPGSHLQPMLLGSILLIMSFLSVIIGIISDIEDTLEHTKNMRFGQGEFLSETARRRRLS